MNIGEYLYGGFKLSKGVLIS